MTRPHKAFDTRFWEKVDRDLEQWTCWLWTGGTTPFGYGVAWRHDGDRPQAILAHRAAWELTFRSPVPPDMMVLHRCDEPSCVNPAHLFLGTAKDNMQDMCRKGRDTQHAFKEFCERGHRMAESAHVRKNGRRHCRECFNVWQRERRAKLREAAACEVESAVLD